MDYQKAIEKIHNALEADNAESAVMACLRVARASSDHVNAAIFLRELYPEKTEVARVLYDDIRDLKE